MKDITQRSDIILLVDTFYAKVKTNDLIGPIFTEVAKLDFESHLPIMYDFWASMILGEQSYIGNPMTPHLTLSTRTEMGSTQFIEWIKLFTETVDELFIGEKAEEIKYRAKNIAGLMLYKIEQNQTPPN